jgi:hypothetical protein
VEHAAAGVYGDADVAAGEIVAVGGQLDRGWGVEHLRSDVAGMRATGGNAE